ncbi:hypothetical protein ACFZC3_07880 [Streptomyces sp. NPDC007903]|uniref:hypothetical protein n=1 Tax=Streptomyces sp. NPDC007903 TaxID=3364786 RepID=UPI0036EB8AC4
MKTAVTVLGETTSPTFPDAAQVVTAPVDYPPGAPDTPPRHHYGPVFGYILEGEML